MPVFQNPFRSLVRDCDIENMSDGWDDDSVYGFVHSVDVPSDGHGPLRSLRYETRNSGLMYIAATHEGLRTVEILSQRLGSESVWDQSAWNQETFRAAFGSHEAAGASVRAMNYLCVLNTKVLFKYLPMSSDFSDPARHLPTMAHMNYHPEKEPRMQATIAFYRDGNRAALQAWNGGEGRRTSTCKHKVGVPDENGGPPLTPSTLVNHTLARNIVQTARPWRWGTRHGNGLLHGPVHFQQDGTLLSPWGVGSWGAVAGPWRRDALHVDLANHTYIIMFLSEKWSFVAVRCDDEAVSYGRVGVDDAEELPKGRLVW